MKTIPQTLGLEFFESIRGFAITSILSSVGDIELFEARDLRPSGPNLSIKRIGVLFTVGIDDEEQVVQASDLKKIIIQLIGQGS
jgi:hypothetical protein